MLGIDFLVMIGALIFFFLRAASDADERKQAAEDGVARQSAPTVPRAPRA